MPYNPKISSGSDIYIDRLGCWTFLALTNKTTSILLSSGLRKYKRFCYELKTQNKKPVRPVKRRDASSSVPATQQEGEGLDLDLDERR